MEAVDSDLSDYLHEGYVFKVNDFLSLKFKGGETVIYVNNECFKQCKYLLLNLEVDNSYDEIDSIDEAALTLDSSLEHPSKTEFKLDSKTEFWGHCSNIQAWAENDYDTRLMHSNLSFPLLRRLTKVGDLIAKRVFKDEIAKRFNSGFDNTIEYLLQQGYFLYLNREELDCLLKDNEILREKITNLQELGLSHNQFTTLPESIGNMKSLERLYLSDNQLTELPEWIGNLESLQRLGLSYNQLKTLPESIGNMKSLQTLGLSYNQLKTIPESIGELRSLQRLHLDNNQFTTLPESIGELRSLQELGLSYNQFTTLPESIGNMKSLQKLHLDNNQFTTLPESIGELRSLQRLHLSGNNISDVRKLKEKLPNCSIY